MRFDYYSASVPATLSHCLHEFKKYDPTPMRPINGIKRYPVGFQGDGSSVRFYSGPDQPFPLMVASGESAPVGCDFIRQTYPAHRVTRLDAAQDYCAPGAFKMLVDQVEPIARHANVAVQFIGDPSDDQTDGRTMYFGSRTSDVRLMVYEKGLEQIGKGRKNISPDWVRMELKVNFRKQLKSRAATFEPLQLYGRSRWSAKVAEAVLGSLPEYIPDPSLRQTDARKALDHMCRQYGRVMTAVAAEMGPEEFLQHIAEVIGYAKG